MYTTKNEDQCNSDVGTARGYLPLWILSVSLYYVDVFIITDKAKASRGGGKRGRCYERRRAKD